MKNTILYFYFILISSVTGLATASHREMSLAASSKFFSSEAISSPLDLDLLSPERGPEPKEETMSEKMLRKLNDLPYDLKDNREEILNLLNDASLMNMFEKASDIIKEPWISKPRQKYFLSHILEYTASYGSDKDAIKMVEEGINIKDNARENDWGRCFWTTEGFIKVNALNRPAINITFEGQSLGDRAGLRIMSLVRKWVEKNEKKELLGLLFNWIMRVNEVDALESSIYSNTVMIYNARAISKIEIPPTYDQVITRIINHISSVETLDVEISKTIRKMLKEYEENRYPLQENSNQLHFVIDLEQILGIPTDNFSPPSKKETEPTFENLHALLVST